MHIIKDTLDFNIKEDTVVTIGKFDGIHLGHKLIFDTMKEYRSKGLKTCVMTFDRPPASLGFSGDRKVLMTMQEKEIALEALGIDYLVEFPFYEKTAAIPALDFIEKYIVERMNAKAVVVGTDCSFGQGAAGNADMLKDYGPIYDYEAKIVGKLMDGKREISSTFLRELAYEGNVKKIDELSYKPSYLWGKLKHCTDNSNPSIRSYIMNVVEEKIMPKSGVYYSVILFEDYVYPAISYIPSDANRIETYLYSDMKGLTSTKVALVLIDRMRDEIDFAGDKEMLRQVKQDIVDGQKWHAENHQFYEARFLTVEA